MAAISTVQSTMRLGVVTINNQRYMATLHYKDGVFKDTSEKTRQVALALFKEVVGERKLPATLVSREGFWLRENITPFDAKTETAWKNFMEAFKDSDVELFEMDEVKGHEREIGARIVEKFYTQMDDENPANVELDAVEVNFLKTRRNKPLHTLASGKLNHDELNYLIALVDASIPR